jgi:hypothetical protein
MKWIHIVAGLVALVAGFLALYSAKGGAWHRQAGRAFAVAMIVMTTSAVLLASFHHPNRGNVVAGTLTFYLVATGVLTVLRRVDEMRPLLWLFMGVAFAAGLRAIALATIALGNPNGAIDHIPAAPLFMFGVVALLGALGDARLLRAGAIAGPRRLYRHLWRMTYALWVATSSAFLGQAKFVPEPYRDFRLLAIPVLLVTATLVFWMVRMQWLQRRATKAAAARSVGAATALPT